MKLTVEVRSPSWPAAVTPQEIANALAKLLPDGAQITVRRCA